MTLCRQILVRAALPVALLLVAVGLLTTYLVRNRLVEDAERRINSELHRIAEEINVANIETVRVAHTMALAQQNGLFGRREESLGFTRAVLEAHPQFAGAFIGYEPNGDGQDAAAQESNLPRAALASASSADPGRFVPYWKREHEHSHAHEDNHDAHGLHLEPLTDMDEALYYRGVRNRVYDVRETVGVTDAMTSTHFDEATETDLLGQRAMLAEPREFHGEQVVRTVYPIIIADSFVGVAGVDRSLYGLRHMLFDLNTYDTARFYLISRRGQVIASTTDIEGVIIEVHSELSEDRRLHERRIEDTGKFAPDLRDAFLHTEDYRLDHVSDASSTGWFGWQYSASRRIPTGGWTIVMRVDQNEIMRPLWPTLYMLVGLSAVGIVLISLWLVSLGRAIGHRANEALALANRVAQGDLSVSTTSDNDDEIGNMMRALGRMVDGLRGLVTRTKQSADTLNTTASRISAAASQQQQTINELSTSSTEIAASVKEISATSSELLDTVDEAAAEASGTSAIAQNSLTSMHSMSKAMEQLVKATESISTKLSIINEKANNIGGVTTAINRIADRTNLLSLNAAIEAEKAGEYGQGFSVVAREIRRLADQTSQATFDIEEMVGEMQGSVTTGVMEMDKFAQQVREGVSASQNIATEFEKVITKVQAQAPRFAMVREGMQSQTQGATQISKATSALAESAQQSAHAIEDFNSAVTQLRDAVEILKTQVSNFSLEKSWEQ